MHRAIKFGEFRFLGSSEIRKTNSRILIKSHVPGLTFHTETRVFVPFHLVSWYKVGSELPTLHQENTATLRNRLHHSSWRQTERANVSHKYTLVHEISHSKKWSLAILNELKLEAASTQINKLSRFQEIKLLGVHSKVIYNINILV